MFNKLYEKMDKPGLIKEITEVKNEDELFDIIPDLY
jgi:mannitol/fructose-specific phosphotransferase system IIA component (Ntr-type)